jgi:phenylacetate-CoA ligase
VGRADAIYARLPVAAQHASVTGFGVYWRWVRQSGDFDARVRELEDRASFTADEWATLQRRELQELLPIVAAETPWYRENWTDAERQAAVDGRLEALPILGKDPIREQPEAFLRPGGGRLHIANTSGSTGTPLRSYWTQPERKMSIVFKEGRLARPMGVSYRRPRGTFSGRLVVPDPMSEGPFHRYNLAERQVYFSAFHLSPRSARRYMDALHQCRTEWLIGYAHSIYTLAWLALDQGLATPRLRGVATTSEPLTEPMRAVVAEAFGCPVRQEYCTVEHAVYAAECRMGSMHLSPDAGVVEVVDDEGRAVPDGEVGHIVTTSFVRVQQPFVRFRLGDMGSLAAAPCGCGSAMPVLAELVGRSEDTVVTPSGRRVMRFHKVFLDLPTVREGQIVQEAPDLVTVRVVTTDGFGPDHVAELCRRVEIQLGDDVTVRVQQVDEIERTKAGKFRAVVSLL